MPASRVNRTHVPSAAALDTFRHAVEHHGNGARNIDDLKTPLRCFCASARREQLPPERVLVSVKRALDELPTLSTDTPDLKDEIRSRLVSLAITTYYSDLDVDGPQR